MDINGKRIVLTGAASGIGYALLQQLLAYDVQIFAVDRHITPALTSLERVHAYECDVSQPENIDRLFDDALTSMGGIDLFIANAGFAYYEKIQGADWARIEAIYRVNVFAPLYSLLKMREINPVQPFLTVITASAMAKLAVPGYSIYGSTKAALDRFADGYRFEQAPNEQVMLVYPISTRTKFFESANHAPVTRPSQPAEYVAARIIAGIQRDARVVSPSVTFNAFRVLAAIFPFLRNIQQGMANRQFQAWLKQQR